VGCYQWIAKTRGLEDESGDVVVAKQWWKRARKKRRTVEDSAQD
jgi:hypothetical protein